MPNEATAILCPKVGLPGPFLPAPPPFQDPRCSIIQAVIEHEGGPRPLALLLDFLFYCLTGMHLA